MYGLSLSFGAHPLLDLDELYETRAQPKMRGPGWGETRALDDHPDRVVRALRRIYP
jgi:hypothetical protein